MYDCDHVSGGLSVPTAPGIAFLRSSLLTFAMV